jgi:hypothetical protein
MMNLPASRLPAGLTATFNPASGTDAFSSTLTFSSVAPDGVPTGTFPIVVSANASGVIRTQTINLSVVQNHDFSVSASPSSVSVTGGGSASNAVTVSVAQLTGNPFPISLYIPTVLPAGVTAQFSPNPPDFVANGSASLTFLADGTATAGSVAVSVCGDNGLFDRCAPITLNVIVTPAGGQNVNVTGTLDAGFLGLTCPTDLAIPLLRGNTNQLNVPCQVYTNTVWNLNVNDTKPTTDPNRGHMVTGAPDNFVMPDSMHVLADPFISGGEVNYRNDVNLAGGGTILTGTNSASAPLVLSQFVRASTKPGTYGIQILFSAVSVF